MIYQHIESKLMARLEKMERSYIEQFSPLHATENALLIGDPQQHSLLHSCKSKNHHLFCASFPKNRSFTEHVCVGHFDTLPYAPASMDIIILAHTLEFTNNPELLLKEAAECLSNQGILFIFAFSPFNHLVNIKKSSAYNPLSAYKTTRFLKDVDLETKEVRTFFSFFSCASDAKIMHHIDRIVMPRFSFLCNAYLIVATKMTLTATLTPLKSYPQPHFVLALKNSCSSQAENL